MVLTSTVTNIVAASTWNSVHCIKKTKAQGVAYNGGSICFETVDGQLTHLGYYGGIDSTAAHLNNLKSKWPALSATFTGRAWYSSDNKFSGYLDYYPVAGDNKMIGGPIYWALFMPKWQTNDYYQNNFRLNKYDSATSYFKDSAALGSTTQFSQGGEFEILAGASTIGLSVAVAFAAAALAF